MDILTNIKNSVFAEVIARYRAEIIARRYYELKGKSKAKAERLHNGITKQ